MGVILNLKESKSVPELLDNSGEMRIIGKHINPHVDLVRKDRSFTTEQTSHVRETQQHKLQSGEPMLKEIHRRFLSLWGLTGMSLAGRIQPAL
jgi:hypothetical protein